MTLLSRRQTLFAAAGLPVLATLPGLSTGPAQAAGSVQGPGAGAAFNRFTLGDYEVTALLAGTRMTENPQ